MGTCSAQKIFSVVSQTISKSLQPAQTQWFILYGNAEKNIQLPQQVLHEKRFSEAPLLNTS